MAKVYVVQVPKRRDFETGRMVPVVDISAAGKFGEMTQPLFPSNGVSFYTQNDVHAVRKLLKEYCDDDSILAVGDPAAIGLSMALAAEVNLGRVNVLRWDKRRREYVNLKFDLKGN
jgi:hypothetical protein